MVKFAKAIFLVSNSKFSKFKWKKEPKVEDWAWAWALRG
jgi:hypothetical protein